ncbi:MAG TPA: GNAT family N-acetyltransferase [Tepidisphaeraceae bacterium]|jgi:RimJ/RimL family protein N-acetyltransferase
MARAAYYFRMPVDLQAPRNILTSRLVLRAAEISDASSIFSEYAQDAEVARYMTWRPHKTIGETEEFLAGCVKRWDAGTEYSWIISLKENDHAVGMISCRPNRHAVEIGYALTRRLWKHGIMSEALRATMDWLWQNEAVYRIWAFCDIDNPASARVMEKAGMQREGILRRWVMHPNISNEPRDCFVYAAVR